MEPFSDLNGAVEKDGAQEGRSATSPCGDVPDWFRRLCCRLGMSDAAPDGWLIYHVKPYVACFGCLTATFAGVAITAPIYMFASQPFRWYHHSLSITHTVAHLTLFGIIWRGGPLAARTWLARISMATVVGSMGTSSLLMILGPDELAIFQSKLAFIVVFSMFMWLTTYSAFLGSWAPDKPSQPYRYAMPLSSHIQTENGQLRRSYVPMHRKYTLSHGIKWLSPQCPVPVSSCHVCRTGIDLHGSLQEGTISSMQEHHFIKYNKFVGGVYPLVV